MPIESYITPNWPAPAQVRAFVTTRQGGYSQGPYTSFNLGAHVADDREAVQANRDHLQKIIQLPSGPVWLSQVHSNKVLELNNINFAEPPEADGTWTAQTNKVCTILTADCLPVLLCDQRGTVVSAVHAGWPGLSKGILENGVRALPVAPEELMAWLGPGISGEVYEVGEEVRQKFLAQDANAQSAFRPSTRPDHWFLDLYMIARQRLQAVGVPAIYGGDFCTYRDEERFFSYRRDGITGRMASLIYLV